MSKMPFRSTHTEHNVIINDDVMVADMRQAKMPGVVRLTLTDLPFAHFHVRSDGEGSKLGFTTGRDDFVTLGAFSDRADADKLLREIRREMMKIETMHKFFSLRTLLTGLTIIIIVIAIVWIFGRVTQQNLPELNEPLTIEDQLHDLTPPSAAAPQAPAAGRQEPGKPVDADSKLNPPE